MQSVQIYAPQGVVGVKPWRTVAMVSAGLKRASIAETVLQIVPVILERSARSKAVVSQIATPGSVGMTDAGESVASVQRGVCA